MTDGFFSSSSSSGGEQLSETIYSVNKMGAYSLKSKKNGKFLQYAEDDKLGNEAKKDNSYVKNFNNDDT